MNLGLCSSVPIWANFGVIAINIWLFTELEFDEWVCNDVDMDIDDGVVLCVTYDVDCYELSYVWLWKVQDFWEVYVNKVWCELIASSLMFSSLIIADCEDKRDDSGE